MYCQLFGGILHFVQNDVKEKVRRIERKRGDLLEFPCHRERKRGDPRE